MLRLWLLLFTSAILGVKGQEGCESPELDEGVMIANKALLHYIPLAAINVTCKAGYYSTTGHPWETMRCRRNEEYDFYEFQYDSTPIECKEGCFAGQPSDYSSSNFTEASPLLHIFEFMRIECGGIVTGWSYYNRLTNRRGSAIFVAVFDRVGLTSFRLANYSVILTTQQSGWTTYIVPPKFRFRVTAGQVIGLAYENWKLNTSDLIIPFRYESSLTYPTYLGFFGIVNLDGRGEIKIGKDVFAQARGRHPAIFSLIAPEVEPTTTTSTTSTTMEPTTEPTTTSTSTTTRTTTQFAIKPDVTDEIITTTISRTIDPATTTTTTPTRTIFCPPRTTMVPTCGPALMVANAFIRSKTFTDRSRVDDKVIYECLEGYQLAAQDEMTVAPATVAIAVCRGDDLSWVDLPNCVLKKTSGCGEIPVIHGAALIHKSFEGTRSMQTGDAVYFGCLDRPNFSPFPPGSELVYCKSDGLWTTLPMCVAATARIAGPPSRGANCDIIPVIRNGQEISRNFVFAPASDVAQVGDSIRFGCKSGYTMRHTDTATCSIQGQWEPLPKCDRCIGHCQSTHLIVVIALPVELSATHMFYLRQYLKALPRAWTYLTATPSTDVIITLIGLNGEGAISTYNHRTPNDPLIRYDDWVDTNVENWPAQWASRTANSEKSGRTRRETIGKLLASPPSGTTVCRLLGPFCHSVGWSIEVSAKDRDRPVRLLYISTSPYSLRRLAAGTTSQSNAEPLLGVPVDILKGTLDFESWVYLLSPETQTPGDGEVPDFGSELLPRGLRRFASKPAFFEQMTTTVELHWELIYPGMGFKHFLCSLTTPNITSTNPPGARATARSKGVPPGETNNERK